MTQSPPRPHFSEYIAVRFGATFAGNVIRAGLSFVTALLTARILGASDYGDLNFLLASFTAVNQLLEMGTSSAFFTLIARRPRDGQFFLWYVAWVLFRFAVTLLAVGVLLPHEVAVRIWLGHDRPVLLLAFATSFLTTQAWLLVSQLAEAIRKTVVAQIALVIQAVVHLSLIAAAAHWGWLTVRSVLWLLLGEYAVLTILLGPRLLRANTRGTTETSDLRAVAREFATYCAPLVAYSWMGFGYHFADRWLLQRFGGAAQQGYFSIGQQFATVSLIAVTSILNVFWKEVAEARERRDDEWVRTFYVSVLRSLYFAAAWVSCLLIPYSREILEVTVGSRYEGAALTLGLMFLYPVHQAVGQIIGTFYYASGHTGPYARIGMLFMVLSIPVTYFMLAPPSGVVPGLGLGAVGLAIKLVLLQLISVNWLLSVISRLTRVPPEFGYQALVLAALLALGAASKWTVVQAFHLVGVPTGHAGVFVAGCVLYAGVSLTMLGFRPEFAGLTHGRIRNAVIALTASLHFRALSWSKGPDS